MKDQTVEYVLVLARTHLHFSYSIKCLFSSSKSNSLKAIQMLKFSRMDCFNLVQRY